MAASSSSVAGLVFTVRRKTPELVAQAKPTPREYNKLLSDIDDQEGLRFQIPGIHFYRKDGSRSMEATGRDRDPVNVIREAIAKTLVWYYPFAGRLRELEPGAAGRKLMVDCTGEGVLFVEADADVTLDQFGDALQPPFPCVDQLLTKPFPTKIGDPKKHQNCVVLTHNVLHSSLRAAPTRIQDEFLFPSSEP